MSGTKTGNKGFVNPVDGKVYTIDPNGVAVVVADSYDPGDMTVDKTVKDIAPQAKITLGTYLSNATKGQVSPYTSVPNAYTIDPSTDATLPSSLTDNGFPVGPSPTGNSEKFSDSLPSSFSNDFSELQKGDDKIKKGLSPVTAQNGNVLLPGAASVKSPVIAYQAFSFAPNYRIPGSKFTTEDILSPPKSFDYTLLKYDLLKQVVPKDEAVVASDLGLKLANVFKTPSVLTKDAKNAYPVSSPATLDLTQLASLTTQGYPTPLTVATSQNATVFASSITPGDSVSNDFSELQKGDDKIKKGLSPVTAQNGNVLLPGAASVKSPVIAYQAFSFAPNYRIPGSKFTTEDITSPARTFDPALLNYADLKSVDPGDPDGVVIAADLSLKLANVFSKPSTLTKDSKNVYPVSVPATLVLTQLASLTTQGYPSPLTVPSNQNDVVYAPSIDNAYSVHYTKLDVNNAAGLQKGRTPLSDVPDSLPPGGTKSPDGNRFLINVTLGDLSKEVVFPQFLATYSNQIIESNDFDPKQPYIDTKTIDILSPRSDLDPTLSAADGSPVSIDQLRQFASDSTQKNKFKVSPPVDYELDPKYANITDPKTGSPETLIDSSNEDVYAKRDEIKPQSTDTSLIGSGFFKGKDNPAQPYDGHNLLKAVGGNTSFDEKLKNSNGVFDPHAPLLPPSYQPGGDTDSSVAEFGAATGKPVIEDLKHPLYGYKNNGSVSSVLGFGNNRWAARATPTGRFNPTLKLSDGTPISHMRMAKVGTGLLQRASGEIPAWIADKFDPTGNLAEGGAILPSVIQAGLTKVANIKLTAQDVLEHLSEGEENPETLVNIARGFVDDDQSWGAAYSSTEQYDDPGSAIGVSLTMIAMVLAINALYSIFLAGNNERKYSREKKPGDTSPSILNQQTKGKYLFDSQDSNAFMSAFPEWREIVGIRQTINSYPEAVGFGVRGFFVGAAKADISFGELALALLGQGLDAILGEGSPVNANLVVCRTIVRSALVFAIAIDSIIKRFQTSPVSGAKAVLGFLRVFRSSKIIASLNVFATLGDVLLDRKNGTITVQTPDGKTAEMQLMLQAAEGDFNPINNFKLSVDDKNKVFLRTFDLTAGKGAAATQPLAWSASKGKTDKPSVRMSRLSYNDPSGNLVYNPTLAWSSKRAPSLYLLPSNVNALSGDLSGNTNKSVLDHVSDSNSRTHVAVTDRQRRIPNEIRQQFEKMLDAEYVPFYFQDVRTNEIISFHAFLTSLSDDYSASYDSVEGFGRVEPVKIYKGTTRKIGLSFIVASTNEADFSEMWTKINKLLTLIYPQYTEGRDLLPSSQDGSTSYRFKAPFSQMIGASPLVRIRLGDLLRSNYSKFSIARIFGAADGTMVIPGAASGPDAKVEKNIDFSKNNAAPSSAVTKDTRPGTKLEINGAITGKVVSSPDRMDVPAQIFKKVTNVEVSTNQKGVEEGSIRVKITGDTTPEARDAAARNKNNKPLGQQHTVEHTFSAASLNLHENEIKKLKQQSEIEYKDSLNAFLDPNNNAIIKSFASAGGKGLAGFIESMNFDWYNQTTWETEQRDKIAPKMCKVTLTFSPIHDISPGIDHSGFNRAPVYRVGEQGDI